MHLYDKNDECSNTNMWEFKKGDKINILRRNPSKPGFFFIYKTHDDFLKSHTPDSINTNKLTNDDVSIKYLGDEFLEGGKSRKSRKSRKSTKRKTRRYRH